MDLLDKLKQTDLGEYAECKKVVLAYSGGLDTSVLLKVFQEIGVEVVTVTLDFGQDEYAMQAMEDVKNKAISLGASKAFVIDGKKDFVGNYVNKAIQANCMYQGNYPCSTALGRPLIAKHLVEVALQEGADAVAHGSTGKGNDYLRFHVSAKALCPGLKVLAPIRDWAFSRAEEIDYAAKNNIPVPVTQSSPYSVDANLWGRSSEGGVIEDAGTCVPDDVLQWCLPVEKSLDEPGLVKLFFEKGIPVKAEFDAQTFGDEISLIHGLNSFAGAHGVGVIDQIEDRTIGLKSREYYECPAATVILKAHKDLELLCLPKEVNWLKPFLEQKFAEYCYSALWHTQAMNAVNAFMEKTQENVNGWVLLKLFKGSVHVVARGSPHGLYSKSLATYGASSFNQSDSKGFANLYSLSTVNASLAAQGELNKSSDENDKNTEKHALGQCVQETAAAGSA